MLVSILNKVHFVNVSFDSLELSFLSPVGCHESAIVSPIEVQISCLFKFTCFNNITFTKQLKMLKLRENPRLEGSLQKLNPFVEKELLHVGGRLSHFGIRSKASTHTPRVVSCLP